MAAPEAYSATSNASQPYSGLPPTVVPAEPMPVPDGRVAPQFKRQTIQLTEATEPSLGTVNWSKYRMHLILSAVVIVAAGLLLAAVTAGVGGALLTTSMMITGKQIVAVTSLTLAGKLALAGTVTAIFGATLLVAFTQIKRDALKFTGTIQENEGDCKMGAERRRRRDVLRPRPDAAEPDAEVMGLSDEADTAAAGASIGRTGASASSGATQLRDDRYSSRPTVITASAAAAPSAAESRSPYVARGPRPADRIVSS